MDVGGIGHCTTSHPTADAFRMLATGLKQLVSKGLTAEEWREVRNRHVLIVFSVLIYAINSVYNKHERLMDKEFLIKATNAVLSSYTTWIVFYVVVWIPISSKILTDKLAEVLPAFDINFTDKQRKKCSKFTRAVLLIIFVTFIFFYSIVRLINL
jgi:hypothetical protein